MSREPLCSWVATEYQELLSEVVRLTHDRNVEHGFVIHGWPDDHEATDIITGQEASIDVASSVSTAYRPIRVGVHTHPSHNIVPSDRDWESFLMRHAQYGRGAGFPDGWRRGMVIASQRMGEEDTFGIKGIEVTEAGIGLSPGEQRDWINDAFGALDDPMVGGLGSSQTIAEAMGEQVEVCTRTVSLL